MLFINNVVERRAMKYKNIVWDWNGTLLNDLEVGVNTLNDMLGRRQLLPMTVNEYKSYFEFPVIRFYEKVGFDMNQENFHELSVDFVETYDKYAKDVTLNKDVPEVLEMLQCSGFSQFVLSALREDLLVQMIRDFSIDSRFDKICGSDNIYADGKIGRGREMLRNLSIEPSETLMIGDTVHDHEVAEALGFDCILFAGGHNDEQRLLEKAPVIYSLKELIKLLEK
jgi:phosphoglycolate phosphatase